MKKITNYNQDKNSHLVINEISHLPGKTQAEKIADQFSSIQNEYEPLKSTDIIIPKFDIKYIPQFLPSQVWIKLLKIKGAKSTVLNDIPAILLHILLSLLQK